MIYTKLKKRFMGENLPIDTLNFEKFFDLIPKNIKSKIIYVVGDDADAVGSYLCGILKEGNLPFCRLRSATMLEIRHRFIKNGEFLPITSLCDAAQKILDDVGKNSLNNETLAFLLALNLLDVGGKYLVIECSRNFYIEIAQHTNFALEGVIFADLDVDESLIESSPKNTKEIVLYKNEDNFDYISTQRNSNGAKVSIVSQNKINIAKSGLFGTDFYYNSLPYRTSAISKEYAFHACLAIQFASTIGSLTNAQIFKGIEGATPIFDFKIHSISPLVLFKIQNGHFCPPKRFDFTIIDEECYQNDIIEKIKAGEIDNVIFHGNPDFISQVKSRLKK